MPKKKNIRVVQPKKVASDSLYARLMKEDEAAFQNDRKLAGFVREYVPGEFPDGFLTEEEQNTVKYTLVKLSFNVIDGPALIGKYPITQEQFEYYQQDPSRMQELEPARDGEQFLTREGDDYYAAQ